MPAASLAKWLEEIERRHTTAIHLGLERIRAVLERLGLARPSATVITIAGTNGKGSTVAFTEAIYRQAGYRVGAYISPHLQRFNERIRIDGEEVGDAMLCRAFEAVESARGAGELTYFEFATAAALYVFAESGLDVIVLEVGLGGRLDAVNAVDAAAAAVVSVALDHMEWLGDNREDIGWEKAHVFRRGAPAVCGDPDPPQRLIGHAHGEGARLQIAGVDYRWQRDGAGDTWQWECAGRRLSGLPLPAARGAFQLQNAACALALVNSLQSRRPVGEDAIRNALATTRVTGRMQRVDGPLTWLFDVAHNCHAAQALAQELRETRSVADGARTFAVFGMMQDKECAAVVDLLTDEVDVWITATLPPPRGFAADVLAAIVREAGGRSVLACESVEAACAAARSKARPGDRVVVFGSFLTVGPGLAALRASGNDED